MRLPRLSLRSWLVASHGSAVVVPVVALLASGALGADLRDQTRWDLEHQGALLAMLVERELAHAPGATLGDVAPALAPLLVTAKERTLSGIRVVGPDGVVLSSSGDSVGEDLSAQAEVAAALAGRIGAEVRPRPEPSALQPLSSESRRANVRLFVAVPVSVGGGVQGAVVLSRTPREELQAMYHMAPGVLGAVLAGVFGAVGFAALAATVATRSLVVLGRGAARIAEGDLAGVGDLARPEQSHVAEVAATAASVTAMTARLRERLAYIGEFASHVAHEFKTPLATLQGTFELLSDDAGMPEAQRRRFLENGAGEVDRLRRLVDGLLALARADEVHARVPLALGELVREVADRHGVEVGGEAAVVAGDRAELATVADNLLRNAFEHGGDAARVAVELFATERTAGFRVVDDGPGISEANLPRVFERFFTTRRDGGGTGLGLALVRAVTRRMGGDTTVESRPGRTVFTVELPRAPG
jgi:signal transduction histidine kinase